MLALAARTSAAADLADVAYDCSFLQPPPAAPQQCSPPALAVTALIEAAEIGPPVTGHRGFQAADWQAIRDRLAIARAIAPGSLATGERIAAQNSALVVALLACRQAGAPKDICQQALALVDRLALPGATLAQLGEEPDPLLAGWLGPPSRWIPKRAQAPLQHERLVHGARAFQPVRIGERRAIFTQLVAIDQTGAPHLTPFIGDVELRRDRRLQAPACVLVLDPAPLHCHLGLTRVANAAELSRRRVGFATGESGGRANCNSCHGNRATGPFNLEDLPASERAEHLARRRRALLDLVRSELLAARDADTP
jgi:hypothetical protein